MRHISTHEARIQLTALLADIETHGESVLICRNGRPIAELRPAPAAKDPLVVSARVAGVIFHDDPMSALDPEDWGEARGGAEAPA